MIKIAQNERGNWIGICGPNAQCHKLILTCGIKDLWIKINEDDPQIFEMTHLYFLDGSKIKLKAQTFYIAGTTFYGKLDWIESKTMGILEKKVFQAGEISTFFNVDGNFVAVSNGIKYLLDTDLMMIAKEIRFSIYYKESKRQLDVLIDFFIHQMNKKYALTKSN